MKDDKLNRFCDNIGYTFQDITLLRKALTHPSVSRQVRDNYQRLEFLGDKVLSLVIAEFLMDRYADENEGDLSKRHSHLVSGEQIAKIGLEIGLENVIEVIATERGGLTCDMSRRNNLENCFEALIGAIYLDSSYVSVRNFVMRHFRKIIDSLTAPPQDPVSELQEFVQSKFKKLPEYSIVRDGGSDHLPVYTATVIVSDLSIDVKASGNSKKDAQRKVAVMALELIQSKK